jgi:hypothetical protein
MYLLTMVQTLVTSAPFTHIAVIIRYNDIPQEYREKWNIYEKEDKVYIYSSEATENHDFITKKTKEGNSLRYAEEYMKSYNGIITCLPVRLNARDVMNMPKACKYMHKHRNRLFNRNVIRYFNIATKMWNNVYNPVRSLCTETSYMFLKKLGIVPLPDNYQTNTGFLEILHAAQNSNLYNTLSVIHCG